MKQLQVTLFSSTGQYKPMSTIVEVESIKYYNEHTKEVKTKAIQKIMSQRKIDSYFLKKYSYNKIKVREYNKEKIEAENKERYEAIKKERGWA